MKSNAIAGRRFASFAALEAHLEAWTREVADSRAHGTTGEPPKLRFERDEAHRLRPAAGIPPFMARRDLVRKVTADCSVEGEEDRRAFQWKDRPTNGNAYSVPWRLIGERVTVTVTGAELRVLHAGQEVARHAARAPGGTVALPTLRTSPASAADRHQRPWRDHRPCCDRWPSMTPSREEPGDAARSA